MQLTSTYVVVRTYLVVLATLVLVVAPIVSAQHADGEFEPICSVDHKAEGAVVSGEDRQEHTHHSHGCGPCHIHLFRRDVLIHTQIAHDGDRVWPDQMLMVRSLSLDGLFRPPRN